MIAYAVANVNYDDELSYDFALDTTTIRRIYHLVLPNHWAVNFISTMCYIDKTTRYDYVIGKGIIRIGVRVFEDTKYIEYEKLT